MLIIERKTDEAFWLHTDGGHEARIIVTRIKGNRVRIGIEADMSVRVCREELRGTGTEVLDGEAT
jgi:carbon storage regulator CsrA